MQHVYIIGSKGIPAKYGGFETFVEKLTKYKVDTEIMYHVACMNIGDDLYGEGKNHFLYNDADCFNISVPNIGPAKAIYYDMKALDYSIRVAQKNNNYKPIFYVLACRIGPAVNYYKKKIHNLGGTLFVNPDGHEWLRAKWSYPVRRYWKYSERLMVKHADLLICDSRSIEAYIETDYKKYNPRTEYIAYGTDFEKETVFSDSSIVINWYKEKNIALDEYYLVVGRFVPENNYEVMIREFMNSTTKKDLVLVTNIEKNKFYDQLRKKTNFDNDPRIKFVGTVYDQELLKYIRASAFAYLHGHEVGGTNPSLLESLALTNRNILLDVGFNREVARDFAFYWTKEKGNLERIINITSEHPTYEIETSLLLKKRMREHFSWPKIVSKYEKVIGELK